MRYLLETTLLYCFGAFFRFLPRRASLYLGKTLGRLGFYLAPGRRKLALENVRLSLGEELGDAGVFKTARCSFESLGMNVAEFFKLPTLNKRNISSLTVLEGEEILIEAAREGNGFFILSGHMGNWDMCSSGLSLRGYPIALISKVSRSEALNRIWMKYRQDLGVGILTGRGTMKESIVHLRKGGMVGFALDQNARRKEGVFVPFFGREACTLSSLAVLSRRTGVPVVPVYSFRDGNVHRIVIDRPFVHEDTPDNDADILERTRIYARWTEKAIRRHPEQWTWLHDRWKTRPRNGEGVMSKG